MNPNDETHFPIDTDGETIMLLLSISILFIILGVFLVIKKQAYRYIGLSILFLSGFVLFHYICTFFSSALLSRTLPAIVDFIVFICLIYFIAVERRIIAVSHLTASHSVDYLIVNGAKLYGSTPSPALSDRLIGTLDFMQSNENVIAVLTGKKWSYSDMSEAQFMYEWLIAHNIPKERLILEESASNTLENIRFSIKQISEIDHEKIPVIGILTSDYHLYRALYIAQREGLSPIGIPVPTQLLHSKINYFIREAFAMTEIYVFGVEGL